MVYFYDFCIMKQILIKHSLKSKIFLRFTLLVGLSLMATGSLSTAITLNMIREQSAHELLTLAEMQSQEIRRFVGADRGLTRLLAVDTHMVDFLSGRAGSASVRKHMLLKTDSIQSLSHIALLNRKGRIVLATDTALEGKNASGMHHFTRGGQGTYVGPLNILQGRRTYIISSPLRGNDGVVLGVLS